jgi:Zn-finger nucleic acid-binding protein
MNVADALHCSGCGVELGLEPIGEPGHFQCPDCKEPLAAFKAESGCLYDCPKCGGQLVEHRLLRDLLERREVYGSAAPRPSVRPPSVPTGPVRYVRCPECDTVMNRKNFGGASGVIVDVCKSHGIWFDSGELPRVIAFVESGGLARARQREADQAAEEKRAAVAKAMRESASMPHGAHGMEVETASVGLLELLLELTRD